MEGFLGVKRYICLDNKGSCDLEVQFGSSFVAEPVQVNAMNKKIEELIYNRDLLPPARPPFKAWLQRLVCMRVEKDRSATAIKRFNKTIKKITKLRDRLLNFVIKIEKKSLKNHDPRRSRQMVIIQYREADLLFMR